MPISDLTNIGHAFGTYGLQAQNRLAQQQFANKTKIGEALINQMTEAANNGDVQFLNDPDLPKHVKAFVGPQTMEAMLPALQHAAQLTANRNQMKANIAKFAAQLGQSQQAGTKLAPNAIPTLVSSGESVGMKPNELESMGLRIKPQTSATETPQQKVQMAGAVETAKQKARLEAEKVDPLKQAQLRAAESLAKLRQQQTDPNAKVDKIRAETEARLQAVANVKRARPITEDIHNAYFNSKLEPLSPKTTIGDALKSGAVVVARKDMDTIRAARMVNDSLDIAAKLAPKLLSKDQSAFAVQKNRARLEALRLSGDPDVKEFDAVATTHIIPFIRSMTNRLNQREIDLAMQSIPNTGDSQASLDRKRKVLKGFVARSISTLAEGVDMGSVLGYKDVESLVPQSSEPPATTDENF